jgi:hypothetical protein
MSGLKPSEVLEIWIIVKRLHRLSDAQVRMAQELGMKPVRLLDTEVPRREPLARRIERLYLKRWGKPLPDQVIPLRQALREARASERYPARVESPVKCPANTVDAGAERVRERRVRPLFRGGPLIIDEPLPFYWTDKEETQK